MSIYGSFPLSLMIIMANWVGFYHQRKLEECVGKFLQQFLFILNRDNWLDVKSFITL